MSYKLTITPAVAIALAFGFGMPAPAQRKNPKPIAFRASLLSLQKEIPAWEGVAANVKVEELPVSYAEGKIIDQQLSIAKQNLRLAADVSTRILSEDRLSDEINLMEVLNAVGQNFQDVSDLLTSVNGTDDATVKQIQKLSQALSAAANGQINKSYLATYSFVMNRAEVIERENCLGKTTR